MTYGKSKASNDLDEDFELMFCKIWNVLKHCVIRMFATSTCNISSTLSQTKRSPPPLWGATLLAPHSREELLYRHSLRPWLLLMGSMFSSQCVPSFSLAVTHSTGTPSWRWASPNTSLYLFFVFILKKIIVRIANANSTEMLVEPTRRDRLRIRWMYSFLSVPEPGGISDKHPFLMWTLKFSIACNVYCVTGPSLT